MKHSPRTPIATCAWRKAWCHPVPSCGALPISARRWTGTSSLWAEKGDDLPDELSRVFEVVCKGCSRSLMTVERLRDPEIELVVDHLRACSASEPLGDTPMLGETMSRVRVAPVERSEQE